MHYILFFALIVVMFTMLTFAEEAQSSDDAHPHQGKVAPFELGDPDVELDSSALNILGSGDPYQVSTVLTTVEV